MLEYSSALSAWPCGVGRELIAFSCIGAKQNKILRDLRRALPSIRKRRESSAMRRANTKPLDPKLELTD